MTNQILFNEQCSWTCLQKKELNLYCTLTCRCTSQIWASLLFYDKHLCWAETLSQNPNFLNFVKHDFFILYLSFCFQGKSIASTFKQVEFIFEVKIMSMLLSPKCIWCSFQSLKLEIWKSLNFLMCYKKCGKVPD